MIKQADYVTRDECALHVNAATKNGKQLATLSEEVMGNPLTERPSLRMEINCLKVKVKDVPTLKRLSWAVLLIVIGKTIADFFIPFGG